jgi:hypothetical protein
MKLPLTLPFVPVSCAVEAWVQGYAAKVYRQYLLQERRFLKQY